jgi:tetratricopeptide (TPR) repeat protein
MGDASLRFGCAPCTKHSSFPLYDTMRYRAGFPPVWALISVSNGAICFPRPPQFFWIAAGCPNLFTDLQKAGCRLLLLAGLALFAGSDVCAQSGGWVVKGAPFRAKIQILEAPKIAEAGVAVELPDFGGSRADLADAVLVDSDGVAQPLAPVWRGTGQQVILLAKDLAPGKDYAVYFGGQTARQSQTWAPKTSLLLETRRLPAKPKIDTWPEMETTWRAAAAADGAGFVSSIYIAGNPFGPAADFASHFTGWLVTPGGGDTDFYTLSSDASFVLVNDKPALEWPGVHSPDANFKTMRSKPAACSAGFTKVDYYQAKIGGGVSASVLGWWKNGKFEAVPKEAWLHPGTSRITKLEDARGWPLPLIGVDYNSYLGYGGNWFFDVGFSADIPPEWTAEWQFEDGAVISGAKCRRVLAGAASQFVTLKLRRGNDAITGTKRLNFPDNIRAASVKTPADLDFYFGLLDKEVPAQLSQSTLEAMLPLLLDFAHDDRVAGFARAWLQKKPAFSNPLWLPAQMACLRTLAQTDPRKALEEVKRIDPAARKLHAQIFSMFELDLLVFSLRDASAEDVARRIGFETRDPEVAALAKIRIGDLYRLTGRIKPAIEQYQGVQKQIADETGGRKVPAQDRAYSIAVEDLLENGLRIEASDKLRKWELGHPMAKFDSDFLLLRGKTLNAFGRWSEALVELDSFKNVQPDSPGEIAADFQRAVALDALGKADEAQQIWKDISTKYPRHELAAPSKARLAKP